jgi:hypothetical protein
MLRPTVSRQVCLRIKHPSGAYDKICITVRQLGVCSCGVLSLTRGWVCRLQLLLALASAVIVGSESRETRDQMSQIRDISFSSPPRTHRATVFHTGHWLFSTEFFIIITLHGSNRKQRFPQFLYWCLPFSRKPVYWAGASYWASLLAPLFRSSGATSQYEWIILSTRTLTNLGMVCYEYNLH